MNLTLEQSQFINNWERIKKEVNEGVYVGGMPKSPAFKGFTDSEKLEYCDKMIDNIKNNKDYE